MLATVCVIVALINHVPVAAERSRPPTLSMFTSHLTGLSAQCDQHSFAGLDAGLANEQCGACLNEKRCKWCPLTQICMASGSACPSRSSPLDVKDEKIKKVADCGTRLLPWQEVMQEAYGSEWNDPRHEDAKRCVQWSLNWDIPDRGDETQDDAGRWGCASAMIRAGIKATVLQHSNLPVADKDSSLLQEVHKISIGRASALVQTSEAQNMSAQKPEWYYDRTTWQPHLCQLATWKQAGACYVRSWKLDDFRKLRKVLSQKQYGDEATLDARLLRSIDAGPLKPMTPGAGKSGSGFANVADEMFKVKLGLKYNAKMNEPDNVMKLMEGDPENTDTLYEHFEKAAYGSMLNPIHGMMKFAFGSMRSYIIILDDAFYHVDSAAEKEQKAKDDVAFTRYDLKGASRNQKEKKETGWCLINGDFRERESNRLYLDDEQCMKFRSVVERDAKFLGSHGMIDYSLALLSLHGDGVTSGGVSCNGTSAPMCQKSTDRLYTTSIIDYVNDLSLGKSLESMAKGGKFSNYDKQISVFAKKICPTEAEVAFREKLKDLITTRHGGSLKKAFASIDTEGDGLVSFEELKAFMKSLEMNDDEHILNLFQELEAEDDGKTEEGQVGWEAFKFLIQ
mmetsp:Transcript_75578/g.161995  ORF Transcript_75578/g.161995 Transcript_75578/m.161995 type:complete len:622 (+) Transcript_75578:89-1954(+)